MLIISTILILFSTVAFAGGSGLAHIGPLIFIPIILFIVISLAVIWALYHFMGGIFKSIKNKKQ
jgi:hypothetical protein